MLSSKLCKKSDGLQEDIYEFSMKLGYQRDVVARMPKNLSEESAFELSFQPN